MAENKFELEFSLRRIDLLTYNYVHIRWLILIDIIGLIVFFVLAHQTVYNPSPGVRETLGIILFWFTLLLAFGFSQPMILFLQIYIFKTPQVAQQLAARKYIFAEDTISIDSHERMASITWNKIVKIRKSLGLFLFYTNSKLAYVIPRRVLGNRAKQQSFLKFALEKIKKPPT